MGNRDTPIYLRYKERVAAAKASIDENKKIMEAKAAQQKANPTPPTAPAKTEPQRRGCGCSRNQSK